MSNSRYLPTFAAVVFAATTNAAVTKLSIPGGEIRDIQYRDANTVYAATQGGGLYRSSDGGVNWSKMPDFPARYVNRIAIGSAGTLYAATSRGVFSSSDAGASWSRLFADATAAIAVAPGSDNTLIFGVRGAGVYRVSAGAPPVLSIAGLPNTRISAIAYDPHDSAIVYLGVNSPCLDANCLPESGAGVYRSTNGGASWSDVTGNLALKFVRGMTVTDDRSLWVATRRPEGCGSGGIHRLTYGSTSWTNPTQEQYGAIGGAETVVADRYQSNAVWAGSCGQGLYMATKQYDGSWKFNRQHVVGAPPQELLNAAFAIGTTPDSARVTVAVRGAGIYTSANGRLGGAAWTEASGLYAARATAFDGSPVSNDTLYVGTLGAGVMRSTDAGATWNRFNSGFTGLSGTAVPTLVNVRELAAHPLDESKAAVVTGAIGGYPGGLFQAAGGDWSQPSGGWQFVNPIGLVYTGDGDTVLLSNFDDQGVAAGIYKGSAASGGFGRTLSTIGNGKLVGSASTLGRVYLMTFGEDDGSVGADGLGVVSHDSGDSWSIMDAEHEGFMRLGSLALAEISSANLIAATDKGLFVSSDSGANWNRQDMAGTTTTLFSGLVYSGANLFAVSRSGGFFCSTDDGRNWTDLGATLPEAAVFVALKEHAGKLYLVTDGAGVFAADPACP